MKIIGQTLLAFAAIMGLTIFVSSVSTVRADNVGVSGTRSAVTEYLLHKNAPTAPLKRETVWAVQYDSDGTIMTEIPEGPAPYGVTIVNLPLYIWWKYGKQGKVVLDVTFADAARAFLSRSKFRILPLEDARPVVVTIVFHDKHAE